ncbi:MAG: SRPBCC family protein [Phycisphaerales bacterium]|nr:SRPBCC family protein [Phycisphaerales bacterium]
MALYIIITLLGLLFVLFGVLGILGSRLPDTHVATQTAEIGAPAHTVFGWIERVEEMPAWVPEITKVERLPDADGRLVHRQQMGRNSFVTTTTRLEPPTRITREIADDHGPFSGTWDHVIEPAGEGACRLMLTETGTVKSPIPRAIMHYFIGEDFYLKKFLGHVHRKAAGK